MYYDEDTKQLVDIETFKREGLIEGLRQYNGKLIVVV